MDKNNFAFLAVIIFTNIFLKNNLSNYIVIHFRGTFITRKWLFCLNSNSKNFLFPFIDIWHCTFRHVKL